MWDLTLLRYNTGVMPHRASDVEYEANHQRLVEELLVRTMSGPSIPDFPTKIGAQQRCD